MKFLITHILLTIIIPNIAFSQRSDYFKQANSWLKEKDYFSARDHYIKYGEKMSPLENLILKARIATAFNRPKDANSAIESFRKHFEATASDSLKLEMLRLQEHNYVRLFEYGEALTIIHEILSNYKHLLSESEISDFNNNALIWMALAGQPKQVIERSGTTVIKMKRDLAKLANIEVKANGVSMDFIFDTGANFSTVTQTTAKAFDMRIVGGAIEVGAVTGVKVVAQLAVCPVFSMGNIEVNNAVFLVFPDSALAFPTIKYQINGIIGFPVIEGLKEVQISSSDEFTVPEILSSGGSQNMALEFLTPIYLLDGEYFTFDTGATGTMLYSKYLKKHENEILSQYSPVDLKFGGAGGTVVKKGYKITFRPKLNGRILELKEVEVFGETLNEDKDNFYGNIGQDVIKQFETMIINFSGMFISFR